MDNVDRGKHWGIHLFRLFWGETFDKWPTNKIMDIELPVNVREKTWANAIVVISTSPHMYVATS